MSLNQYFQKHIFEPLELRGISMFPDEELKSRMAHMNSRLPSGDLAPRDHLLHRPLVIDHDEDVSRCVNSGGAGCFAQLTDYTRKVVPRQDSRR